jgi:hypothetical protein
MLVRIPRRASAVLGAAAGGYHGGELAARRHELLLKVTSSSRTSWNVALGWDLADLRHHQQIDLTSFLGHRRVRDPADDDRARPHTSDVLYPMRPSLNNHFDRCGVVFFDERLNKLSFNGLEPRTTK